MPEKLSSSTLLTVSGSNPPPCGTCYIELQQLPILCRSKQKESRVWSNREDGRGHFFDKLIFLLP